MEAKGEQEGSRLFEMFASSGVDLVKCTVLLGSSFSWSCGYRMWASLGAFWSVPIGVSGLGSSPVPRPGYTGDRQNPSELNTQGR